MEDRIIKFRAWDKVNKRMGHFESGFAWNDEYYLWHLQQVQSEHDKQIADVPCRDNIILMQFTGHSIKGKELFQGDIVKSFHFMDGKKEMFLYHKIMWDEKYFCWKAVSLVNKNEALGENGNTQLWVYVKNALRAEIIGNIYQHPNLISKPAKSGKNQKG